MNPQTAALNPAALIAASQQRSKFIPLAGTREKPSYLVVQFPGESMRCPIEKVINDDTVIIRIDSPPMSRIHSFRFDEVVGVRRRVSSRGETWEAQTERDFLAEQKRRHAEQSRPVQQKPVPVPEQKAPEPKKAAAKPAPVVPAPAPKKTVAKKPPAKKAAKRKAAR